MNRGARQPQVRRARRPYDAPALCNDDATALAAMQATEGDDATASIMSGLESTYHEVSHLQKESSGLKVPKEK